MITVRDLSLLPAIDELQSLMQSLALLDAIMSPDWQYRYYSFDAHWSADEQVGTIRNGMGDDLYVWFGAAGSFVKGFAHESPLSPYLSDNHQVWPGVLDSVPIEFAEILTESAFRMQDITFSIWRRYSDLKWQNGNVELPEEDDADGFVLLVELLDGQPVDYQFFASEYYEKIVPISAIEHIYNHQPLTDEIIKSLNPSMSMLDLQDDIAEIGYP